MPSAGFSGFPVKMEMRIQCSDPEAIIESIKPDEKEAARFKVKMKAGKNELVLHMESTDIAGLQAGLNSYLRLIRTVEGLR